MNLKDILAKVRKGETLTDEEKTFLESFDPDAALNNAAAAARRKAEADAAALQKQIEDQQKLIEGLQKKADDAGKSGQTELEKAQSQIKTLSETLSTVTKRLEDADKKSVADARNARITAVAKEAGVQFIPGFDHELLLNGFARSFEGIKDEDLGNKAIVDPIVSRFREVNKAVIAVAGHGAGGPAHVGNGYTPNGKNPFKEESFNLTEQARLLKQSPAEAQRLAAEAGQKLEM